MRHPVVKTLILLMAALFAVLAVMSAYCGVILLENGLYEESPEAIAQRDSEQTAAQVAEYVASRYATEQHSNVPDFIMEELLGGFRPAAYENYQYTIFTMYGKQLEGSCADTELVGMTPYCYEISGAYPRQTEMLEEGGLVFEKYGVEYYVQYLNSPEYLVTIYLQPGSYWKTDITNFMYTNRFVVIFVFFAALLLDVGCMIYLCCSAGKRHKEIPANPRGINRLPLDLYLAVVAALTAVFLAVGISVFEVDRLFKYLQLETNTQLIFRLSLHSACLYAAALLFHGYVMAFSAQKKVPGRFWLKNTLAFRIWRIAKRLAGKLLRMIAKLYAMLPVMWQWLLTGAGFLLLVILGAVSRSEGLLLICCVGVLLLILYGAWAFGTLLKGAKTISRGALNTQISTRFLVGAFRNLADYLNAVAGAAEEAARLRMQSERMRTELITNVSHDIKTPLTSILNYADLLRSAQSTQQQEEYLQVISNQGMRLKRLIEDITELSRASTGNLHANITAMNASEALTQVVGEFSDKIASAQLQLCPRIPDEPVMIAGDGRLFWRVITNLMSNVVKYAQPGTRVYAQLICQEHTAQIVIKNISREPLNISAQELMERFVRGDAARNTEGSGLGLSIAASLMEVQKGSLELRIDGDLFCSILEFPLHQT